MPEYLEHFNQAMASKNVSPQALERRVHDLCHMVKESHEVFALLKEIEKASTIKGTKIPTGLSKPLKFCVDHLCRFEFDKKGAIDGFHFDPNNIVRNSGKLKFIEAEIEESMNRCYVIAGSKGKECSFFDNKKYDTLSIMEKVRDALESVDYTKIAIGKDGKMLVPVSFNEGKLTALVNHVTSEVLPFYPEHDSWDPNLPKKLFGKK